MSYTWRSILKGRDLMLEGVVWRVGDGESIAVWDDPWFQGARQGDPHLSKAGRSTITKVSELMNPVTEQWDAELIRDHFNEADVSDILSIPVRPGMVDTLAWHYDTTGIFTVKYRHINLGYVFVTVPSAARRWSVYWSSHTESGMEEALEFEVTWESCAFLDPR